MISTRSTACAITGLAPSDMPYRCDPDNLPFSRFLDLLSVEIQCAYLQGYRTFVTTGSMGVALWGGQAVLDLRRQGSLDGARLIVMLPYVECENEYPLAWKNRFYEVLERADRDVYIQDDPSPDCLAARDAALVRCADRLIVGHDGATRDAAYDTMRYALDRNRADREANPVQVIRLHPSLPWGERIIEGSDPRSLPSEAPPAREEARRHLTLLRPGDRG